MTLQLYGVTIHEADVALTDVALACLGVWCTVRLWKRRDAMPCRVGAVIMAGLASAALFGAFFHAFFPEKTNTTAGFAIWLPVAFSIGVAAAAMLELALSLLVPGVSKPVRYPLLGVYLTGFMLTIVFVDESYGTIVRFYGPALLLLLAAVVREALRREGDAWRVVAGGLALSVLAAVLQQGRVQLHPTLFDHNALYHLLQGIALLLILRGLLRVPSAPRQA